MTTIVIESDEHWRALRAKHGGSSEAAALFGIGYQDMPSAWSLWALHSGKMPPPQFDDAELSRIWFGKQIEPVIADAVQIETGWQVRSLLDGSDDGNLRYRDFPATYVECPDDPRLGCTVDRYIVEHEDGDGILEIKNRDYLQWIETCTEDQAGTRDVIQLAHQLLCHPDISWGMVAMLVGGNTLKTYRYTRDDLAERIADLREAWTEHWRRVDEGDEPDPVGGEMPAWLQAHIDEIHARRLDTIRLDGTAKSEGDALTIDETIAEYARTDHLAKAAKKQADAHKTIVTARLDGHGIGRTNKWDVRATYVERKPGTCKSCGAETSKASTSVRLKVEPIAGYNEADDAGADNSGDVSLIDAG